MFLVEHAVAGGPPDPHDPDALGQLMRQRDSTLREWDAEEESRLRVLDKMREMRGASGIDPAVYPDPPPQTTVSGLIASGIDLVFSKSLSERTSTTPRALEAAAAVEPAAIMMADEYVDDDDDDTPTILLLLVIIPGVLGVLVIVTMIVLGANALLRARTTAIENSLKRQDQIQQHQQEMFARMHRSYFPRHAHGARRATFLGPTHPGV